VVKLQASLNGLIDYCLNIILMKSRFGSMCCAIAVLCAVIVTSAFYTGQLSYKGVPKFPYKAKGLTEREAAAHLLSRFTYGATPGQVDEVVNMGLEKWFAQQLEAQQPDDSLKQLLKNNDAVNLSTEQLIEKYPRPFRVTRMMIRDSVVNKDSIKSDRKEYKDLINTYMQQHGMVAEQELYRLFINQKVLRAAYTQNQLQEVMTDFWFNHFNVSITKNQCAIFIPTYERDVIRPNVFGKFNNLLLATAKSPAMLVYLDNSSSAGDNIAANPARRATNVQSPAPSMESSSITTTNNMAMTAPKSQPKKNGAGINENYAREVMELHTLGVDGGYTQSDVTQAARVLTGWTIYPMGEEGYANMRNLEKRFTEDKLKVQGYVHDGEFLFTANRHDRGEKTVLGKQFGPDGGYQEGVDLLNMLAHHPSAAKFITRKLAVRFVSDNPPQSLLNKMVKTFNEKDGDIKEVLITMVSSPEFWSSDAVREKTKSPFELAIGAVRSLKAQINQPYQLYTWINRMGEKKYYYQAPTGFPDKGQYWINTGSLLNRMNFGLALALGRIPGVTVNLLALNQNHEPESALAALTTYSKLIMPERNLNETIKRLTPMLNDPLLMDKVAAASAQMKPVANPSTTFNDAMTKGKRADTLRNTSGSYTTKQSAGINKNMLSQVVGVIIGSPEFQRR
jgi:uncharacterized protein (DUF1800 family)